MTATLAAVTLIAGFWTLASLAAVRASRRRTDDLMSRQIARTVHLESRALCQGWRRDQ